VNLNLLAAERNAMSKTIKFGGVLLTATALASGLLASHPASAQDAAKLEAIQQQIQALQSELKRIRSEMAQRDAQVKAARDEAAKARADAAQAAAAKPAPAPVVAAAPAPGPVLTFGTQGPPPSMAGVSPPVISGTTVDRPNPTFQLGGVRVTLGGFVDVTGIWRSANEFRGLSTGFNAIPFNNDPNAHLSEFRMTAQATRLSMLCRATRRPCRASPPMLKAISIIARAAATRCRATAIRRDSARRMRSTTTATGVCTCSPARPGA
jgi:outer membrane murein-binding lipoprotein Lpp